MTHEMIFILTCIFLLCSCDKHQSSFISGTVQLDNSDEIMAKITEDSRNTLSIFFRHLSRPLSGEHGFCVKIPLETVNGGDIAAEQLWLKDIHFKNGTWYGNLANTPRFSSSQKQGDTLPFSADSITDWMFIRGNKIIGGYSIKYLLEKINENERSEEQRILLQMF